MRVVTSKSKNAESFYISKGYVNDKGVSTSVIVRKLGTLKELLPEHGPTRDDVMAWAREEARLETLKYKQEQEEKQTKLTLHADRQLDYDKQVGKDRIDVILKLIFLFQFPADLIHLHLIIDGLQEKIAAPVKDLLAIV